MTEPLNMEEFFPEIASFGQRDIFKDAVNPWDALDKIHDFIIDNFPHEGTSFLPDGLERHHGPGKDDLLYCTAPLQLEKNLVYMPSKIMIGVGTKIEPSAMIKAPAIIGSECDVRAGAYLRGNIITGNKCTLGHATEIKNSILMNHCEAGHFNYIGDSVLGSYVNLGAGTILANLKFRSPREKKAVEFPRISFIYKGEKIDTGVSKFGAVLGDYCETGCNSVTSPGVLLAPNCWVYPNTTVPSGHYSKDSFISPEHVKPAASPHPKPL